MNHFNPGFKYCHRTRWHCSLRRTYLFNCTKRIGCTIHWTHRVGAIIASAVLLFVAVKAVRYPESKVQFWGKAIIALLALQIATGISNVVFQWPLVAALLHTGGAAAILFCLVRLSAWSNSYFLSGKSLQQGSV
ncbi:MAG: hypothetical protein EBW34_02440 [Burkholderiaceae bacterium]|nr:hypothetical protein [Burkholderiaceae bacterium]